MAVQLIDPDDRIPVKDSELPGVANGDPGTTYTLRPISVNDHRRLSKENTKTAINRQTHMGEAVIDYEALNDDILDFVLLDWSGILLKGQPAPCIREHKLRLDGARRAALSGVAGMNQIQRAPEVRAESFRQPS